MLGASFLPARFRSDHPHASAPANPGYINREITRVLQSVSRKAFTHPIHTIVFVALLASTSYIGLLEGSLFDGASPVRNAAGDVELSSLAVNGRHLRLGEETAWKWQVDHSAFGHEEPVRFLELKAWNIINIYLGHAAYSTHDVCLS